MFIAILRGDIFKRRQRRFVFFCAVFILFLLFIYWW